MSIVDLRAYSCYTSPISNNQPTLHKSHFDNHNLLQDFSSSDSKVILHISVELSIIFFDLLLSPSQSISNIYCYVILIYSRQSPQSARCFYKSPTSSSLQPVIYVYIYIYIYYTYIHLY